MRKKQCQNVPNKEHNRDKGEHESDDLQEAGESSRENKTVARARITYQLYFNDLAIDF